MICDLLLVGLALGFPVAGLGLAVSFGFDLALDGVGADLAVVLRDHLVAIELPGHGERDLLPFHFALGNGCLRGLPIAARAAKGSGQLFAIDLQFEGHLLVSSAISTRTGPAPGSSGVRRLNRSADREDG